METRRIVFRVLYEKVILGNRVPVADEELVDYIIDGIPDETLRNQARLQNFDSKSALLKAFEVSLRCKVPANLTA